MAWMVAGVYNTVMAFWTARWLYGQPSSPAKPTELWPKQTLLKQSPLGTIFSGPDKVILFFFSSSHCNEHRAASFDIPGVDIQTQVKYCILFCLIVFANLERFTLLSCPSVKIVVNIPYWCKWFSSVRNSSLTPLLQSLTASYLTNINFLLTISLHNKKKGFKK